MTTEYDKEKAEKLFKEHLIPVRDIGGHGAGFHKLLSTESPTHYVITPEMLRFFRAQITRERPLRQALYAYVSELEGAWYPEDAWDQVVLPDPKPTWRIAADQAADNGESLTEILDAVEKALATEAGK